jgi:hypothetical protein
VTAATADKAITISAHWPPIIAKRPVAMRDAAATLGERDPARLLAAALARP